MDKLREFEIDLRLYILNDWLQTGIDKEWNVLINEDTFVINPAKALPDSIFKNYNGKTIVNECDSVALKSNPLTAKDAIQMLVKRIDFTKTSVNDFHSAIDAFETAQHKQMVRYSRRPIKGRLNRHKSTFKHYIKQPRQRRKLRINEQKKQC